MIRNHPFAVWTCLTLAGATAMVAGFWFGLQNGSMSFMVFAVLCIVILGVRDKFDYSHRRSERTGQLSGRAAELGFDFQESAPFNVLGWDDAFKLTKPAFALQSVINESSLLGRFVSQAMPKSRNVLLRSWEEARLAVFDYQFTDDDVTYNQATAAIQSACLDHPHFALFPANVWHKFSAGFRTAPAVHVDHRLLTEATVSSTAIAAIAESLDANTSLEIGNGYLLLYRSDRRPLKSDEIETKISEVLRVYAAVSQILAQR